ncbi:MAG TPA: cupin domain-containing protein [Chloroflexia bacterium]|jgi:mannose-6-phosphate isomerase-like protein (cupin superfamily)
MDPRFGDIFTSPENSVFKVVFFPDRIYHAAYLSASRSSRYRYNVREVRSKLDTTILKGEVYMDGKFLCNFMRIEYRAGRLVELAREEQRRVQDEVLAWVKVIPADQQNTAEATVRLHYSPWIDAHQVEIWETLEPPPSTHHDFEVLDQMGWQGPITRVMEFGPALRDIKALKQIQLAFRESDRDLPAGYLINDPQWDNNYMASHQEPRTQEPSSPQNTIEDNNYQINFQRGWYFQAEDITPVRYVNAMMDPDNPDRRDDNVIEMRWLVQRDLGSSVVFFHEVTIPPGEVEGTHRHIGSEELYYIVQGEGLAYLGVNDDPTTASFPTVQREIYGLGMHDCKEVPVKPGSVIYTKSGGIHGIRNPGTEPLKFVAFLYHSA